MIAAIGEGRCARDVLCGLEVCQDGTADGRAPADPRDRDGAAGAIRELIGRVVVTPGMPRFTAPSSNGPEASRRYPAERNVGLGGSTGAMPSGLVGQETADHLSRGVSWRPRHCDAGRKGGEPRRPQDTQGQGLGRYRGPGRAARIPAG